MADMTVGCVIPAVNSGNYPLTEKVLDKQKIVMCKDCEYSYTEGFVHERLMCEKHPELCDLKDDWFCADGWKA